MPTPPIPVAIPLLVAAALAALHRYIPRRVASGAAILTAAATTGVCISLAMDTRLDQVVYWFGNWAPRNGAAIGIAFVVDAIGAWLALLASLLVTAALVFSSRYFDTVGSIYQVLMLAFLAAMCGFCLTGDLFNLFVFFELMSAAAFALCGYKSEEPGPLQGALNFAVTNTAGAFLALSGIALLYGRTGALNMAQIGRTLAGSGADRLVITAFTFLTAGFLVKAAVVPFHFWLPDAHSVAPTPVCVLFSGIMVELGLYAVMRIYWTAFSGALDPRQDALRNILIGAGVSTAVLGAVLCFSQRHIKRLLAFSTISHMGLMLAGFGLLSPDALAGAVIYIFGHGLAKASLFLSAGILLHRTGSVDELDLRGWGRGLRGTAALFTVGAVALAGAPPFGTWIGSGVVARAADRLGYGWLRWVDLFAASLTAGAVLRIAGRVFGGWGPAQEAIGFKGAKVREKKETRGGAGATPAVMAVPAAALLALSFLMGFSPGLRAAAYRAADSFVNRPAYAARVLEGRPAPQPASRQYGVEAGEFLHGGASLCCAFLLAYLTLASDAVRNRFSRFPPIRRTVLGLRCLQTGVVCDYMVWLTFGVTVLGGLIWWFTQA